MSDNLEIKQRSRTINRLSAREVETATSPGVLMDGGGLLLRIADSGRKQWLFRYHSPVTGKRREMGLGRADRGFVSLKAAREAAQAARDLVARKLDPIDEAERERTERLATTQRARPKTFGQFTDDWLTDNESVFRNAKHRAQWRMTLEKYGARLRDKLPSEITTEDVLAVLRPLWQSRPETAKRTQGRIERVWDAARAKGLCTGENPARWRGHLKTLLPARTKLSRGHHAAMAHRDLPAFITALRKRDTIAARALEFLILTSARSGEVREMRWCEVDLDQRRWTVPAKRMKAGKEHRVPLGERAIEILRGMLSLRPAKDANSAFVFPGSKDDAPMSDMTLAAVLKRMELDAITVHGFRSSFRDWAEDVARYPFGVIEAALAHTISNATVAAYRRGDAYDQRSELMEVWEAYLGRDLRDASANVVELRAA